MGRRNKEYSKTLHQQAYDRLTGMQAFGESKKEAVANGTDMLVCSKALGHNRISVVADNYIRGL